MYVARAASCESNISFGQVVQLDLKWIDVHIHTATRHLDGRGTMDEIWCKGGIRGAEYIDERGHSLVGGWVFTTGNGARGWFPSL